MLSYVKTFAMQIVPSVAATIIGAYIVNHYIVAKPAGSAAPVAASISAARPKVNAPAKTTPEAKPADAAGDVANLPEAGVKAKGISEKALLEKNASAEKAVVEKSADKVSDKTADKPAETASIPAEPRRHTPAPREKTAVRVIPLTAQPAAPAPVVAAPAAAPVEAAVPEERRDANDLARAAIDRLRGGDNAPRQKEAARAPETPRNETPRNETSRNPEAARVPEAPRVTTEPAVRPLPPPVMVSAPAEAANVRVDDPRRPTPPAEIPALRPPLDLRAEMAEPKKEKSSVVDDVLSATKSVFHSVLPK